MEKERKEVKKIMFISLILGFILKKKILFKKLLDFVLNICVIMMYFDIYMYYLKKFFFNIIWVEGINCDI